MPSFAFSSTRSTRKRRGKKCELVANDDNYINNENVVVDDDDKRRY
jgi:hypothetical protein